MNTTPRFSALIALAFALVADAGFAQAQTSAIRVRSSRTERASVAPGGVLTAPFTVLNTSADSVAVAQVITLPAGWTMLNSMAPTSVAANGMELWLVSVSAPAGAPAGTYVLRAGMKNGNVVSSDSLVIDIEERYELDVHPMTTPTFVMSGESYGAQFSVRNNGNVTTTVSLKATSNHGSSPKLTSKEVELKPGASTTVAVTVLADAGANHSIQDLLEVVATDKLRDTVRAEASVETTIIPKANGGADFWTVPGQVSLRAATPGSGVSPLVATGTGRLTETSNTTVDYSLHTSAGSSSVFGERDEYRLALRNDLGSIKVGDDSYGFSNLTSNGSQGMGAELRGTKNGMVSGAYVQRNRFTTNAATEVAGMVGFSPLSDNNGSLILLHRGSSTVLGGTAQAVLGSSQLEFEAAHSDSSKVGGAAATVRLYGTTPKFGYDVGAQGASSDFAGAQRASTDQHLTLSGAQFGALSLSGTTAIHSTMPTAQSDGFGQRIATTSVAGNFTNGSAVEFERFDRADHGSATGVHGNQNALRVRGRVAKGNFDFLGSIQEGVVAERDSAKSRGFTSVSASVHALLGNDRSASLFGEMSDGKSLGAGGVGTLTAGGSADLRIASATMIHLTTSATSQRDGTSGWVGQADFTIEQTVRSSIIALRGRMSKATSAAIPSTNAFYLEVRTPLRLPTSRLDVGGRAHAQIVDAETGKGVQGALVRMGEQAAITDKNGAANFKHLELGEYHAIVEGGIAAGQLVNGGSVDVAAKGRPANFTMTVARGARIAARLRRYEKSTNSAPTGVDSVVDVGAIGQAVVALISNRDTVWQSSDDRGRIDFGSVAPGHYTVKVVGGDLPEFTEFEKRQIDVDVTAGDVREVELRAMPLSRTIEIEASETVLVAAPVVAPVAAPTTAQAGPMPRSTPTPVPQQKQRQQQQQNNNND